MDKNIDLPLISVVIPTRNRAQLVQETIQSVLSQQWENFELVVSNNHSSDNTQQVLEEIAAKDKRVRVVSPPEALPMTAHWNWAWSQIQGEYGAFLSDDDVWEPTFLQTVADVAKENPDIDVIATDYVYWKADAKNSTERRPTPPEQYMGRLKNPLEAMLSHNLIFLNSSLVRRDTFHALGGYGPTTVGDFEFWIKASLFGTRFYYIPESHLKYRMHTTQVSQQLETTKLSAEVLEKYVSAPKITWAMRQRLRRSAAGTWALVARNAQTEDHPSVPETPAAYFRRGVAVCPWHPTNWVGLLTAPFRRRERAI